MTISRAAVGLTRLAVMFVTAAVGMMLQPAKGQPTYETVSLADLRSGQGERSGRHIQTTGLLSTASDSAVLRAAPVDPSGVSIELQGVPGDQLSAMKARCRFGCPATVRGVLQVRPGVVAVVAETVLVQ